MMKLTSNFLRLWLLIVLVALFSRIEVVQSLRNSNDSKHGYCSFLDLKRSVLLVKHDVQKKSAGMFRMFRKKSWSVRFPEHGNFSTPIKCIIIHDNGKIGRGGFARIESGGVNYRHVVLYFRGDVNFNIEIYGDERNVRYKRLF